MQSGLHGLQSSFISVAKLRLREPIKTARDAIKSLEDNLNSDVLKDTVDKCTEGVYVIRDVAVEDLGAAEASGFIKLLVELVHRVVDIVRNPENIKKLGPGIVVETIDKFVTLIDDVLRDIGSFDAADSWVQEYQIENFQNAFPASSCVQHKHVSTIEIQAHSRLFVEKGDILRYRSNINKEGFDEAAKAYWFAFTLTPTNGMIFNQLGVVSIATDLTDRLSYLFFFVRAIHAKCAFESAKEALRSKLGIATEKMLESNFTKYTEIFRKINVTDLTGISAASMGNDEYFFSWFNSTRFAKPAWKLALSKLPLLSMRKILQDHFLHIINLLIHKQSHSTLSSTCERFLALTDFMLEDGLITDKEVLQLTTIMILTIKFRESVDKNDETFKVTTTMFVQFIGLLLSKVCEVMEKSGVNDKVLPAIVVIVSYWDSLKSCLSADSHVSNSLIFDYMAVKRKIVQLRKTLRDYLSKMDVTVEISKNNDETSDDYYVLPEMIYSCWGSGYPTNIGQLKLSSKILPTSISSIAFSTYLLRISMIYEWLSNVSTKGYFSVNNRFETADVSSFEFYALSKVRDQQKVLAIYPELLVIDTNTLVDEVKNIMSFSESGIKIAVPSVVLIELKALAKTQKKNEATRQAAQEAFDLISSQIVNEKSGYFQIYNYYGERKFDVDVTPRDIAGLNNKSTREKARDTNDDYILTICRNLEGILEPTTKKYGHHDPRIIIRKVVLITADKVLRIKSRAEIIPTCGFSEFHTWYNKCK